MDLGGFRAVKRGTPSAFGDIYYSAMEMSWPGFAGAASVVFLVVNAAFGLVYAAMPGSLVNARPGSFLDGFFFSVETLATVGYGNMAPANHLAHAVATAEIMCGLLLTATMTGLTFARFARPRDSILFSAAAVVTEYEGGPALMIRIASLRSRPIADVTAQLGWVERRDTPDGRPFRRVIDLPLVRSRNAMLTMSWTITHLLDPEGDLLRLIRAREPVRLIATVGGLDTMLATPTFGGRFYFTDQIIVDHDFVDMIDEVEDGRFEVDLRKLDLTRPRLAGG